MFLKRRQDLFTMVFRNFCWVEKDKIWIEIPIKTKNKTPLEVLIIQNKEIKDAFEKMEHLKKFIYQVKLNELKNTSLAVFVEHSEITNELFDAQTLEKINELAKYIVTFHITDQM